MVACFTFRAGINSIRRGQVEAAMALGMNRVQALRRVVVPHYGDADVLTLYLLQEVNLRLRPRILSQMRPGARVISHDFDMGDWHWDQRQRVGNANIYLWIVPARIDGAWTLKPGAQPGTTDATYMIDLKLSSLVPGFIEKALAEQSLPGLLANFKARAEKLGSGKT